jgi:RNA polymerase sigma-70 factor, ECF subfamily
MDSDGFTELVTRLYEPLYRFALSLTRAEADARDLTQETFYVWAAKGHQLRDQSKAKAWLFTTLHRSFLATYRRHTRFPHCGLEEVAVEDLPTVSPDLANVMDSPQVLSALAKVDEVYQAAVALFYLEDCSYREIAQILEVPVGTVKSRIARGIEQLRQLLGFSAPVRSLMLERTRLEKKESGDDGQDTFVEAPEG